MSGPKYAFSILAQKLRRSLSQHGLIKTVQAARAFGSPLPAAAFARVAGRIRQTRAAPR